ncbi:uncharacterized protein ARMOST_02139 [Armillaria ostoyae]|uniref:Uncharacterized protein n=1 Tax=Armillaria ostoyae TaxID=47428 RepID=A0A284QQY5_ARMOS|nr:uncharacterized protein ARMOST_02139 [Armillaria ostoyae]
MEWLMDEFAEVDAFYGLIDVLSVLPYSIEVILQQDTILHSSRLLRALRPFKYNHTILLEERVWSVGTEPPMPPPPTTDPHIPSRGTAEVVPSSTPSVKKTSPSAPASASNGPVHTSHPACVATQVAVTTSHCFVKGVTGPVSQAALSAQLVNFGMIKEIDITFQSLRVHRGGGGGVWVEISGEVSSVRITVETKKERGDRPVSRPRGGAPQGETWGGGGFRGARGRGGRGAAAAEESSRGGSACSASSHRVPDQKSIKE